MKKICLILILSICMSLLASCSSGDVAYDEAPTIGESASPDASYGNDSESGDALVKDDATVDSSDRKLIRIVKLQVETKEYDALLADLNAKVTEAGGYIESSSIGGTAYESKRSERTATITYRIPSEKLDAFLTQVGESCNIIARSEQTQDMTLNYVDLESRIKTLEAERDALLAMLEKAETTSEMLSIRNQLNDVIYRYESAVAQLRALSERIAYSTVTMTVSEVLEYTEVKEEKDTRSLGEKAWDGFLDSWVNIGDGLAVFGAYLLIALPYLLLLGAVFGGGGWILYLCLTRRTRAARKLAKQAKQAEEQKQ